MIDVLMVVPPPGVICTKFSKGIPPLGIGYILSVLAQEGFTTALYDFLMDGLPLSDLELILQREKPKIIGVYVSTIMYRNAVRIAKIAKKQNPEILVVFGGPHCSALPHESLTDGADIVVRGEGEYAMLEIAKAFIRGEGQTDSIAGTSYKKDNKIIDNTSRDLIENLDILPFPAYDAFGKYPLWGSIATGRGCPYQCIFCAGKNVFGGKYRFRSVENVFEEIKILYDKYNIREFCFVDDTFTAISKRAESICNRILQEHLDIVWWCETRADCITKDLLELMKKSGCKQLQYGVESGDNRVLRDIRKGTTIEMVERSVKVAFEAGILSKCSFMIGHHSDTPESVGNTMRFIEKLIKEYYVHASVGVNTPFPGSDTFNHAKELGIDIFNKDWNSYNFNTPVFNSKYLTAQQISSYFSQTTALINNTKEKYDTNDHIYRVSPSLFTLKPKS
ncbi:MAG: B12-binding domain-containing radical SAM protein [Candidatus Bathyarchaeota archaeon]|nr:B12-binding domain-containing radical SAM protein [Candidatus Termiticorpusculum sp.]